MEVIAVSVEKDHWSDQTEKAMDWMDTGKDKDSL